MVTYPAQMVHVPYRAVHGEGMLPSDVKCHAGACHGMAACRGSAGWLCAACWTALCRIVRFSVDTVHGKR